MKEREGLELGLRLKHPVVLAGGLWENDHIWEDWALDLRKLGYEVRFASMEDARSFGEAVSKVRSVISEIGVCNLIGHSLGGLVCRKVAGITTLINKLVAVCPVPANPFRLPPESRNKVFQWQYFNPVFCTGDKFIPQEEDMEEMFGLILPPHMRALNYGSLVRGALFPTRIAHSKAADNLVVSSSWDPTCGPNVQSHLEDKGFRHMRFTGADHYPMLDACRHENLRQIVNWMEIRSNQRTPH